MKYSRPAGRQGIRAFRCRWLLPVTWNIVPRGRMRTQIESVWRRGRCRTTIPCLDCSARTSRRSQFNRYNLEVYLSIANLYRQNSEMIAGIHQMDMDLASAAQVKAKDPKRAIADVDRALDIATSIWRQRNQVLQNTVAIWDESWFPRVADANGRHFLHEMDDVKDHLPDRTVDMTYLVYREKILPFGTWVDSILSARNEFATAHQLPVRNYRLAWDDFGANP